MVCDLFHAHGMKVTPQRQAIVRSLYHSTGHPTAEITYDEVRVEMPTVSLKTVYQTIHTLVALGQLRQTNIGSGSIRFDPISLPHHHLVCTGCGRVEDVFQNVLRDLRPSLSQHQSFAVQQAEVVVHGRCLDCATTPGTWGAPESGLALSGRSL